MQEKEIAVYAASFSSCSGHGTTMQMFNNNNNTMQKNVSVKQKLIPY